MPAPHEIKDHLQHVYFRTERAEYFLRDAHDGLAVPVPEWAREFYQLAVRAFDSQQWIAADENAKRADEIARGLESLAQAAHMPETPYPPHEPLPPGP